MDTFQESHKANKSEILKILKEKDILHQINLEKDTKYVSLQTDKLIKSLDNMEERELQYNKPQDALIMQKFERQYLGINAVRHKVLENLITELCPKSINRS